MSIRYLSVQFWKQWEVPGEPGVIMSLHAEHGYELTYDGGGMLDIAKDNLWMQHPISNVSRAIVDRRALPGPMVDDTRKPGLVRLDASPFIKAAEILKPTIDQAFEPMKKGKSDAPQKR